MYKFIIIIFVFLLSLDARSAGQKVEGSELSSGDIIKFIEKERRILRGKFKVNLPKEFTKDSSTMKVRFGNKKPVLNLNELSFGGADLRGAIFTTASMLKTNLNSAQLQNSDFVNVDFTGSDLRNADFSKADLSNAKLEAVDLEGAIFDGANLFGAQFIKTKGLTKGELKDLKKRTTSYVNLEREPLPDYYNLN